MAATPQSTLAFSDPTCGDCGRREAQLPEPLPIIGDDFDWLVRDYDGFRIFMLEELAARFPERRRWTPADMEVVIVEALSVILDQLSDMADRVHGEAFLESARRPESVRRLLSMIGYDAIALAVQAAEIPDARPRVAETAEEKRIRLQRFHPALRSFQKEIEALLAGLAPAQREQMQLFLEDPDLVLDSGLDQIQDFLDGHPGLVTRVRIRALERYWTMNPGPMEAARQAGPRAIHTQKRMVTEADYGLRLNEHPLVLRSHASAHWSGSWTSLRVAVVALADLQLEQPLTEAAAGGADALAGLQQTITRFHRQHGLARPVWAGNPTIRTILRPYLDAYRMAGQEVFLQEAEPVGINIALSTRIAESFFRSEIRRETLDVLGTGLGGFFAPGRLDFGQDLFASDIIETVMALDGVEAVCLNRFKRVGKRYADQSASGRIQLDGLEIAVCDDDPQRPERGYLRLTFQGGRPG